MSDGTTPAPPAECRYNVTESPAWRRWVTPRAARDKPIHRWHLFAHSFTSDLVHALVDEWKLDGQDALLDPFAGAGTTLLAAKEKGVPASGYDLSPLAVLISNVKTETRSRTRLESIWRTLDDSSSARPSVTARDYPMLVQRALPNGRLEAFEALAARIRGLDCTSSERDFFRLALISIIPRFSRAVANGGWLRWAKEGIDGGSVEDAFNTRVEMMLSDVQEGEPSTVCDGWRTRKADARKLPDLNDTYTGVITSPPYPNRHDYTRVFGVELMFDFLNWEENRSLRHQSFHSHPEARPERPPAEEYVPPAGLEQSIDHLRDGRIRRMLHGYFLDMYLCLREVARVCRGGAKMAFVVGNAQYDGRALLVDEFTAELGERAGLACSEIRAVRWRGNSAQQMGRYGRAASRESVVMFNGQIPCQHDEQPEFDPERLRRRQRTRAPDPPLSR